MKKVRVGVIGVGGIFQFAHLPSYPEVNEAQIIALCDMSEETLKRAEKRTREVYLNAAQKAEEKADTEHAQRLKDDLDGLRTYTNASEMFSNDEIDLVDICTPTKFHNSLAMEALNQGVNVMVEKPMARTYLECLEVMETIEDTKKLYQHNENWVYTPLWYTIKKFIESGVIGELQMIFMDAAHNGPEWASWFWDPEIAGGGALLDMGVHAITCSWFLNGFEKRPIVVKASEPYGICMRMKTRFLQGMFRPFDVEDDAHISVRYEDERGSWSTAHIEGSWSYKDSMEMKIIGTNGEIKPIVKDEDNLIKITDTTGREREINLGKIPWIESFQREIRNMCNCVMNNVKPLCNEKIGAETTAIVQAAYLSQKRGKKAVTIEQFKKYALRIREKKGKNAPDVLLESLLKGIKKI